MKDLPYKKQQINQIVYALSLVALFQSLVYHFYFNTHYLTYVPIGAAILAHLITLIFNKTKIHFEIYGNILLFIFWGGVFLSLVFGGGINSAGLSWLTAIPIVCSIVLNMTSTLFWSLTTIGTVASLAFIPESLFLRLNEISSQQQNTFQVFVFFGAILICSVVSVLLERKRFTFEEEVRNLRQISFQQSKLSSLGELAAGISHEINNPLAIIKGLNQRMDRKLKETPEYDHFEKDFLRVYATIDRIGKIVNSLKRMAKAESVTETCDLNTVLQDLKNISSEKSHVMGIELEIKVPHEPNMVIGDEVTIGQVLINLLNNSFDEIVESESPWVKIWLEKKDDTIKLYHMDSGTKIDPKIQDKIFDPFFTTKEIGKGTGIGLSISKSIMQGIEGDLTYLDQKENTTFLVTFKSPES